jgi:hypothetical protein
MRNQGQAALTVSLLSHFLFLARPKRFGLLTTGFVVRFCLGIPAGGASATRAAAAFDRSISSIRARARLIGSPLPSIREMRKKVADAQTSLGNALTARRTPIGNAARSKGQVFS